MASESHPLACQLINVRGRDLLLSVTAEVSPSKIISQDEDNIDGLRVDGLRVLVRDLAKRHSFGKRQRQSRPQQWSKNGCAFFDFAFDNPSKEFQQLFHQQFEPDFGARKILSDRFERSLPNLNHSPRSILGSFPVPNLT